MGIFVFGSSAISNMDNSGDLPVRPFAGVAALINVNPNVIFNISNCDEIHVH